MGGSGAFRGNSGSPARGEGHFESMFIEVSLLLVDISVTFHQTL